jgi:hypothetical protein
MSTLAHRPIAGFLAPERPSGAVAPAKVAAKIAGGAVLAGVAAAGAWAAVNTVLWMGKRRKRTPRGYAWLAGVGAATAGAAYGSHRLLTTLGEQ